MTGSGPDVDYDVRVGKYKPMSEAAVQNGQRYSTMTSRSKTQRGWGMEGGELGPGQYGYLPSVWDLKKSAPSMRPTSSFLSKGKRMK